MIERMDTLVELVKNKQKDSLELVYMLDNRVFVKYNIIMYFIINKLLSKFMQKNTNNHE